MADFIKPFWTVRYDPEELNSQFRNMNTGMKTFISEAEARQYVSTLQLSGYKKITLTHHPGYIIPSPQKLDIYEVVTQTTD